MRVVIMGPPGSGKGTQAVRLAEELGLHHLSTGEMLRAEIASGSDLGQRVEKLVDSGALVPDELITELVLAQLAHHRDHYLLDGYPRSLAQAHALLASEVPPEHAVVLEASEEELRRRMLARAEVEARSDDNADVIATRLKIYSETTMPAVELLVDAGVAVRVDAERAPDAVGEAALEGIRRRSAAR